MRDLEAVPRPEVEHLGQRHVRDRPARPVEAVVVPRIGARRVDVGDREHRRVEPLVARRVVELRVPADDVTRAEQQRPARVRACRERVLPAADHQVERRRHGRAVLAILADRHLPRDGGRETVARHVGHGPPLPAVLALALEDLVLGEVVEPLLPVLVVVRVGGQEAEAVDERPLGADLEGVRLGHPPVGVGLRDAGYCGYGTSRLLSVTVDVLRSAPGNLSTVR